METPRIPGRALLLALGLGGAAAAAACERARPPAIVLLVPRDLDEGAALAVEDLRADLGRITGELPTLRTLPGPGCRDHQTRIVVLGPTHDESGGPRAPGPDAQAYTIDEARCGDEGRRVVVRGESSLAAQWAVYDLAQRLGVRYFHPESTYYPESLEWPESPLAVAESPAFRRRSMHAHRKHPIELSPPLGDEASPAMAAIQRRWVDWAVKMRQTEVDGWDADLIGDYAYRRGFGRVASLSLLGTQQGGRPRLDPDDPRPPDLQLRAAVDEALAPRPGAPPVHRLELQFGSSEFTEIDPALTLARLAWITHEISAHHPEIEVEAINHGTFGPPRPPYGVRFYDLPGLAPPALGAEVHPLMFYDLERGAAGVYGNDNYRNLLEFIRVQAPIRRIVHYPESSWWLTFDLPVPLYLAPATIDARAHDIALLRPLLADRDDARAGVVGHHLFTSGQEWGYWLIDYCVAQMTWDSTIDGDACVGDFAAQMAAGAVIREVLAAVTRRQIDDLRDPEILRLLVGSDDETEAGAAIGIHVHPLPPRPEAVIGWDDPAIAALEARGLAPLRAIAADYHGWADQIEAILPQQSPAQAPWVRELRDGLRIFALRAEHAVAIYEGVIELRAARAGASDPSDPSGPSGPSDRRAAAEAGLERARALTEAARALIRRREADYRYSPELTIAGDERGTPGALANRTVYPFRVLSRTHRLMYWERPDRQLAALVAGDDQEAAWVRAASPIVGIDGRFALEIASDAVRVRAVEWGDGEVDDAHEHRYAAPGVYHWSLRGARGEDELRRSGEVAVVERAWTFPRGALKVREPASATLLDGLLPGFAVGFGDDGEPFLVIAEEADDHGSGEGAAPLIRRPRAGDQSVPGELRVGLRGLGELVIADAVIAVAGGGPGEARGVLRVEGALVTDNLIELLLASGGFAADGARAFLAERLGVTVATLPSRIPVVAGADGHEGVLE